MQVVRTVGVVTVLAGAVALAVATGPSVDGQGRAAGERERRAEMMMFAGRGAEIGVSIRDVEPSEATSQNLQGGVFIVDVRPDSPAAQAGLKQSDIIVEFDGERVRSARQFSRLVDETTPGHSVKATILREGTKAEVSMTPTASRRSELLIDGDRIRARLRELGPLADRLPFNLDVRRPRLGVDVEELTPQLADYFGVKEGVLVSSVADDSPAARAGLKAGDVITTINNAPVRTSADLVRLLRDVSDRRQVTIGIVRDRKASTVTATIEPRGRTSPRVRAD